MMKCRKSLLIVILINIIFFTIGCSKNIDISVEKIESNIINNINVDNMKKGNQKSLRRLYGINPNDLEEFSLYTPKSNMDVEEMLILKVKNEERIDDIKEKIENRVDRQITNFDGYGIKQVGLLNNYEIKTKNKYIFFVVSDKSEEIKELFIKSINQ
ncbi:DUF4358 domain-containing protein [Clostridium niameyense]|uniref:DUF4358 domain-containing protein n=1 Tax=Clostridium niameyense TaxID=1622073 RepID=UPI00067EFE57|nr:DUF4358 domain-containing protein [Clostridium niameyense]